MRNIVLQILAALSYVLFVSCQNVTPPPAFNPEGMEGKWYITGFGSNEQWLKDRRGNLKTYSVIMEVPGTGDMHFSYTYLNEDGSCFRATHLAEKSETPGRFTFHSDAWNNDNDMHFVDVVNNNYAIVLTVVTNNGKVEVMNTLYTRTTEASAALRQKFKRHSLRTGILAGNTVILPPNGECRRL